MDSKKSIQLKNSADNIILSHMGTIIQVESNTKPLKINGWPSNAFKPQSGSISRSNENDFSAKLSGNTPSFHFSQHIPSPNNPGNGPPQNNFKMKKKIVNQIEKFCKNTTLHGIKYVGDPQFSFGARIFWFIAFALAAGFAGYFISNIYAKWKTSPVIISYNPFEVDISSIPFPVVTICNMNRAKKNEAEIILKNGTTMERKLLDDTCDGNSTFNDSENVSWESLRDFLIRVGNSCSDLLKWCHWGGQTVNCEDIFNNELTDEGLCCSFNRLPPEKIFRNWKDVSTLNQTYPKNTIDWDPEKGFQNADDDEYIPRRPLGAGPKMGLSVVVDAQLANYYCSSTRSTGFKVMLSSPRESPKVADFGFLVGPGFENCVFIEPLVREATFALRSIPVEKRQCYFVNERPLQYYRSYTQRNCLLECQSQYTFKLCRCVPYYLPKNKYIKYCSKREKDCVEQAKVYMETVNGNGSGCHCLPGCFFVKYPYGKSMSYLYNTVYEDLPNITGQYFRDNMAVMHFFFSKSKFTAELKSELFGFTENLSNTGGLLSLFLGISFLSLIELIYFVSLRVICGIAKKRRRRSRMNKEIMKEVQDVFANEASDLHINTKTFVLRNQGVVS